MVVFPMCLSHAHLKGNQALYYKVDSFHTVIQGLKPEAPIISSGLNPFEYRGSVLIRQAPWNCVTLQNSPQLGARKTAF